MSRRIIIAGGSGFIGRYLVSSPDLADAEFVILSRNSEKCKKALPAPIGDRCSCVDWDGRSFSGWEREIDGAHAIINLSGDHVGEARWSDEKKRRVIDSRTESTRILAEAVKRSKKKPEFFLQASAIGYYGAVVDELARCTEESPSGPGFLAHVVRLWEESLESLEGTRCKISVLRYGVVLGKDDGMVLRLSSLFRWFMGGYFGTGRQIISWIHIDDAIRAMAYILNNRLTGVFNLTSPEPVSSYVFAKFFGRAMRRPSWFRIPSFVIKLVYGQMGEEIVLKGQWVYPSRLLTSGFVFNYPSLKDAFKNILM